jgi:hypothetical protein
MSDLADRISKSLFALDISCDIECGCVLGSICVFAFLISGLDFGSGAVEVWLAPCDKLGGTTSLLLSITKLIPGLIVLALGPGSGSVAVRNGKVLLKVGFVASLLTLS